MKASVRILLEEGSRKFDVRALIDALGEAGIPFERLEFDSHVERAVRDRGSNGSSDAGDAGGESAPYFAPSGALVHDLRIQSGPERADPPSARLTLNLGLLSSRSPLPAYFLRYYDDPETRGAVLDLLTLLDRSLLRERVRSFRPERHAPEFERAAPRLLALAQAASPASVFWLFSRVFPELDVSVRRGSGLRLFRSETSWVGSATLSSSVLGGRARVAVPLLEVVLSAPETLDSAGTPWSVEASRRVREIALPALARAKLRLRVTLSTATSDRVARVGDAIARFDALAPPRAPHRVEIFSGEPRRAKSNSVRED